MYRSILVPLDGSELSEQALPLACDLARHLDAQLHLVHVASAATPQALAAQPDSAVQVSARVYLKRLAERLADALGRPPTSALLSAAPTEKPAAMLANYATVADVDLIVMTSHGHGGLARHRFGSVATVLLGASSPALLLLRPAPAIQPRFPARLHRLLLPLDGNAWAEQILAPATALALAATLELALLHVVDPHQASPWAGQTAPAALPMSHEERQQEARAYLEQHARVPRSLGLSVNCCACLGAPVARSILTEARQLQADLIGLSVPAHPPWQHEKRGVVVASVLREAQLPLLLYRYR